MLILLAFIILFHITSAAFLFISTIDSAWWVGNGFRTDLWHHCVNESNCTIIDDRFPEYPTIQAMQSTMILATIFCCLAFFSFLLQLFRLKQGERFVVTSVLQLVSCLFVMVAASIYTDRYTMLHKGEFYDHYNFDVNDGEFGYSFILAWIAFAFTLVSGLMYLILRKRK